MDQEKVIKSVCYSQDEIFRAIIKLYCPNGFDLDPTYSRGQFYKNIQPPRLKYDIAPLSDDVICGDCRSLPLADNSIASIVFDPPFCFGIHGKTLQNISAKRFTMFKDFDELAQMYQASLREFYRVLKPKGILAFKCQDYTDKVTIMTHCHTWYWAYEYGFYAKDLFILVAKNRIYNPNVTQRHARKFHSYMWVFEKR